MTIDRGIDHFDPRHLRELARQKNFSGAHSARRARERPTIRAASSRRLCESSPDYVPPRRTVSSSAPTHDLYYLHKPDPSVPIADTWCTRRSSREDARSAALSFLHDFGRNGALAGARISWFFQKCADDFSRRAVHKIPVVDVTRVPEVKIVDRGLSLRIRALELPGENHEGEQAILMEAGLGSARAIWARD